MNKTNLKKTTLFFLAVGFLVGCTKKQIRIEEVEGLWIPSVKEVLPIITAEAEAMDPEAKLQRLTIELFPSKDEVGDGILARFDDQLDNESIIVWYYWDGTIFGKVQKIGLNITEFLDENIDQPGIEFDDTIIDSPEALSIMMDYANLDSSYSDRIGCSELVLDEYNDPDFGPAIWMLFLRECEGEVIMKIGIDAHSGELIFFE